MVGTQKYLPQSLDLPVNGWYVPSNAHFHVSSDRLVDVYAHTQRFREQTVHSSDRWESIISTGALPAPQELSGGIAFTG